MLNMNEDHVAQKTASITTDGVLQLKRELKQHVLMPSLSGNQKLFILFLFYVWMASVYAIILVSVKNMGCSMRMSHVAKAKLPEMGSGVCTPFRQ